MTDAFDGLAREYVSALEAYLQARDEPALSRAYELGRRAMVDGLGVLDVATLQRAALKVLVLPAQAAEQIPRLEAASDFFHEFLSPFELSLAGYRSANDELQRLNESLRRQKEEVENVNRELESFSYSVSHDLRAPLRAIDGFSQILVEDFSDALGDDGKKHLSRVREGTRHMGQLIDDLLKLARVTRTEINRSEVDLTALARTIADRLRATAPDRTVTFKFEEEVRCSADPRLLAVLFENLLGNAWKFTSKRERAEITFGRESREGNTVLFVRDNGAGFDMAHAEKLFGAFQRLHSAREFEGTGIGLATVQRVVHRHGGQVWADSEVDGGATFYFTLGIDASP
jgi:light-regulated signal transduction histidine kinase (bacteriophytochrome)